MFLPYHGLHYYTVTLNLLLHVWTIQWVRFIDVVAKIVPYHGFLILHVPSNTIMNNIQLVSIIAGVALSWLLNTVTSNPLKAVSIINVVVNNAPYHHLLILLFHFGILLLTIQLVSIWLCSHLALSWLLRVSLQIPLRTTQRVSNHGFILCLTMAS